MIAVGEVADGVAGFHAFDVKRTVAIIDDVDFTTAVKVINFDAQDIDRRIACQSVGIDEILALIGSGRIGADLQHGRLATLQLDHFELSGLRIQDIVKLDIGFDIRLVLIQVGDGVGRFWSRDEGEVDALASRRSSGY